VCHPWRILTAHFFDDHADHDLHDHARNSATHKVARHCAYSAATGCVRRGTAGPKKTTQKRCTANATDGTGKHVTHVPHVRAADDFAATCAANGTANELCNDLFHLPLLKVLFGQRTTDF
jgi:hypothetical protein